MKWVTPKTDFKPRRPIFLCVLSSTDTAKIPGISAAGKAPELTDYTPAGDAELVDTGRSISIKEPPMTPLGTPTPAVITRAALQLTDVPYLFINSGLRVRPKIPAIDIGVLPGKDIRTGEAVPDARDIYDKGVLLGRQINKLADLAVIGESVPGGTTTAMGVLHALGYQARVSSSFSENPLDLKKKVIMEGMKARGISFGSLRSDPLRAVECLGDPMMPCIAGLVESLRIKTVLAGGTQMIAVYALIKHLGLERDVSIATTKYIARDTTANFKEMMEELGYPAYIADPGFDRSKLLGLKRYEEGDVKEGVGAGGAMFLASLLGVTQEMLRMEVEKICEKIF